MAVGHFPMPVLPPIDGIRLASVAAGIRYADRKDLLIMEIAEGATTAGVFTQNAFCAAPVALCKRHLPGPIRYLLVNSGNANACTGEQGLADAEASCAKIAELAGVAVEQVLPFSTGVIGEPLAMDKILAGIPEAMGSLTANSWTQAAEAIMTTDTRAKGATQSFVWQGQTITVNGISKGSGMINPNMATMLAYIATDASVDESVLQDLLKQSTEASFNRITVDGDTSTNDSCILVATGKAGNELLKTTEGELYSALLEAIKTVQIDLAKAIVTDGEGATKFITVNVAGGAVPKECLDVAYAVAHSPLVKTAFFASDANWGRIVAAIGYSGVDQLDDRLVTVALNDVLIVENGGRASSYQEQAGQAVMDLESISINIDLNRGDCFERVWTTDLSHDYITINAEYRS